MKENDPLSVLLQAWEAPEPSPAMDARVLTAYQAVHLPRLWRRLWSARVSIPVPVLAALLLIAAALWIPFRSRPSDAPPATLAQPTAEYLTHIETAGFKPLTDAPARVIRSGESKQ